MASEENRQLSTGELLRKLCLNESWAGDTHSLKAATSPNPAAVRFTLLKAEFERRLRDLGCGDGAVREALVWLARMASCFRLLNVEDATGLHLGVPGEAAALFGNYEREFGELFSPRDSDVFKSFGTRHLDRLLSCDMHT